MLKRISVCLIVLLLSLNLSACTTYTVTLEHFCYAPTSMSDVETFKEEAKRLEGNVTALHLITDFFDVYSDTSMEVKVKKGEHFTPYIPYKYGGTQKYDFKGWYKDSALTVPYVSGEEVQYSFTLYAKWELRE